MQFVLEPIKPESDSIWDDVVPIVQHGRDSYVYLTDSIGAPSDYNKLCTLLRNAYTGDIIHITLNNPGGVADSAFMIINAMIESKAHIICRITGLVASASTMIAMYADELVVDRFAQFMVHNYSHGTQGTGSQVRAYVEFTDNEFKEVVREIYSGFLSEEEMDKVSNTDKELWFNETQIKDRWARKLAQ